MTDFKACDIVEPASGQHLPVLFSSPHSGRGFPADFACEVSPDVLNTAWDAFVEDLWGEAPRLGATLIHAGFPRTWIDPNRAPDDIDPHEISGDLDRPCRPTVYSERGMGLIRKFALPGIPMYEGRLTAAEVTRRIEDGYQPYHDALSRQLEKLYYEFGSTWLIDCHSMKSRGNAMNIDAGEARPDFVLGDLDGSAGDPALMDRIEHRLESLGYSVSRNKPYKGGYIIQRYNNPSIGQFAMQIEINRRVYMDEAAFEPNSNYTAFKGHLTELAAMICKHVTDCVRKGSRHVG